MTHDTVTFDVHSCAHGAEIYHFVTVQVFHRAHRHAKLLVDETKEQILGGASLASLSPKTKANSQQIGLKVTLTR